MVIVNLLFLSRILITLKMLLQRAFLGLICNTELTKKCLRVEVVETFPAAFA